MFSALARSVIGGSRSCQLGMLRTYKSRSTLPDGPLARSWCWENQSAPPSEEGISSAAPKSWRILLHRAWHWSAKRAMRDSSAANEAGRG